MANFKRTFQHLQWLLMLTVVSLSGCGGCRRDDEKLTREELEKRAQEQKDALELGPLLTLPTDGQAKVAVVKPGHWHESQQLIKSNREDLQIVAVGDLARAAAPVSLPGTNMINEYLRRTSLPKGQTKTVDLQFFIPESAIKSDDPFSKPPRLFLRTQLRSWPLLTPILQTPSEQGTSELLRHEYQFVVLSPQALSYEFLSILDTVLWRGDDLGDEPRVRSYTVSLIKPIEGKYAMPRSLLTMTATAALLWDDVSPEDLTSEQQEAIVDWVHWGGQLIVSGPSSWSRLQNSFLSPYLPATSADAVELNTESFAPISDNWVAMDISSNERPKLEIIGAPVSGLKFKLNESGMWLPNAGEMVAERQVGRGRVVVTAFPLREPRVTKWKYFSSFLSTGLLRRAPRTVANDSQQVKVQKWVAPFDSFNRDPRMHSNLRILSRDLPISDASLMSVDYRSERGEQMTATAATIPTSSLGLNAPANDKDRFPESMRWGVNGGAWNDYSSLGYQAQNALRKAAGIKLPARMTIVYLVGGYLLFLVPINWLIFRILGRLEYAWIAAPILALVGVIVVTRVARLDIGFARRTTEISLLEVQGQHPRAHLTRYVALYTSLSTNYAVDFPESGSVVLPLGDVSRVLRRAGSSVRNLQTNYGTSSGVRLEPLTVYSNSTEMLHAEQMISLKGGITLEKFEEENKLKLMNATELSLKGAMVVRNDEGQISYAWLDTLAPQSLTEVEFKPATAAGLLENWNRKPESTMPDQLVEGQITDTLWVGGMLQDLLSRTPLMPGQSRLIAYTDDRPGELTISPAEEQFDGRCVVVAHLSPAKLAPVAGDRVIWSGLHENQPAVEALEPATIE